MALGLRPSASPLARKRNRPKRARGGEGLVLVSVPEPVGGRAVIEAIVSASFGAAASSNGTLAARAGGFLRLTMAQAVEQLRWVSETGVKRVWQSVRSVCGYERRGACVSG